MGLNIRVVDDWAVEVGCGRLIVGGKTVRIDAPVRLVVSPLALIDVERERYDGLPVFVHALRDFARRKSVALADASGRWGRLWQQGIPHTTLLLNAINHPDERGMKLYADSLMALFDE